MSKRTKSGKLKSLLAIIIVAVMVFGTVASLVSVAFAGEVASVEVTSEAPLATSN